jgi:hypothetical protein
MPIKTNGATTPTTIEIQPIRTTTILLNVRGRNPLILNRVSEKAQRELLLPKGRKTTAERAASLKHDPMAEFAASPYRIRDDNADTLLAVKSSMFKAAMMTASLRLPGAKKTEIGQLLWVEGELTELYGVPELLMSVTRNSDPARTPDIRTRCIVPEWAAKVAITFATPILTERSVINLFAAAGQICGIGDWRPEKGKGTYGQFVLVDADDERFGGIVASGGRAAQMAAMEKPAAYDEETEDMLRWFDLELKARGRKAEGA